MQFRRHYPQGLLYFWAISFLVTTVTIASPSSPPPVSDVNDVKIRGMLPGLYPPNVCR